MSVFGDIEPEDSWDRGDPTPILIDNLFRRLAVLGFARLDDGDDTDRALLSEIIRLVNIARDRSNLTPRELMRIRYLDDDAAYIAERLNHG